MQDTDKVDRIKSTDFSSEWLSYTASCSIQMSFHFKLGNIRLL